VSAPPPVHFLLVDDLEANLLALEGMLRRDGLELLKARSGAEALELLLRYDVALALIDVQMPEMDGFEVAELMRGTERTRRVPIIFLTAGSPDHQRRFRGYEAGAVDFLTKPIEPHVLRSKAGVFFELWRERQEVARQRDELKAATAENARLLEETRRTAEALKEADRRKDEFLATLAHELRNPLAPIRNGLEVLRLASDPAAAARTRAMMERQLEHMVRLVDDLLDISRVTSGKVRLRPEPTDLRDAVKVALDAARPAVEAGRHALVVNLPDEPLRLFADPTRLAQAVGNLITNAAKYTPGGGRIEVSAAREGGEAVVRVADNGVGIPPEMLPRVFDLFTQVGKHLDRAQGGLGIGLALVKRLVELHGGGVTAQSEGPGRGSAFTLRLPVAGGPQAEGAAEGAADASAAPPGAAAGTERSRRVLVVDDNADAAETLAEWLALRGHEVRTAQSGNEALEAAPQFRPEVVFLDIGLPGMSGYDVARRLRQAGGCSGAVFVALTGWGTDEDRRRSEEAGFALHLVKPIENAKLDAVFAGLAPRG
jgi:signal transduction histidine kinase